MRVRPFPKLVARGYRARASNERARRAIARAAGARTRLKLVLERLRSEGLLASGTIGDPDPYTAITNALQYFRVDDIVISTFEETRSGWLRTDLIERVRRATGKPVEHVVHHESERASAA